MIHEILEVHWQMWDYRNTRFRGPGGLTQQKIQDSLDQQIDAKFAEGFAVVGPVARLHARDSKDSVSKKGLGWQQCV